MEHERERQELYPPIRYMNPTDGCGPPNPTIAGRNAYNK